MKKEYLIVAFLVVVILISGCTQPPVCGNGACEAGENHDNCPQDCQQQATHLECQNQQCVQVQGSGVDECRNSIDCVQPVETHLECQNQQCVEVEGAGEDGCTTDADCQQCEPPKEQIVRDKMIWDLPELCEFTYGGLWERIDEGYPNECIDLRYMSPQDNDQHSEFYLCMFNSSDEADSYFKSRISSMVSREINGNKIFERTVEEPAGIARAYLWVSGSNVIIGWNGNDAGTVYDDALFNILAEAYLEKYPSTVS
ncbi:MAG: hypothetical protein ABIE23_06165 [archaeon]